MGNLHRLGRIVFSADHRLLLRLDLTLAGHTHGGQLSLEFLHRGLCFSRLMSSYRSE